MASLGFADPAAGIGYAYVTSHVLLTVVLNRDLSESQVVALDVKSRAKKVLLENVGMAEWLKAHAWK